MSVAVADRFARYSTELAASSPQYSRWAAEVRDDPALAARLASIPAAHRQPVLVFAVARELGAADAGELGPWVREHLDLLRATCVTRTIQTNDVARCAALVLGLAQFDGPVALLEVGASAGLCLALDRYAYEWTTPNGTVGLAGDAPTVRLASTVRGHPGLPTRMPQVVWRAGADPHPVDVATDAGRGWLRTLLPPGQHERMQTLDAAIEVALRHPPRLVACDAVDTLRLLNEVQVDEVPDAATRVVLTSGVLVYLSAADRARFAAAVLASGARWLAFEPLGVVVGESGDVARSALTLDGVVLATADPHARELEWARSDPRITERGWPAPRATDLG